MEFSEDWKTVWPISSFFTPPLVLSDQILGPLFFNPIPKTLTHLFTSPSLSPPPSSLPRLSLSRFLITSSSSSSFLAPSLSSSLSHRFGPEDHIADSSSPVVNNCLQLLPCPSNNTVLVFFPIGENSDQVGFIELLVKDSNLIVRVDDDCDGDIYISKKKFNHRIVKILVNPLDDDSIKGNSKTVANLLVCTLYSVHWFSVKINGIGSENERPSLVYLNGKVFKSCAVVNACWNPHLPEESVVVLDSGKLFLFNLDSFSKDRSLDAKIKGTRLRVSFDNLGGSGKRKWLGCHFSWHPMILIVACSDAVFLVDLRFGDCRVSCLANSDILGKNGLVGNNQFVAFSKAGPDVYYFTLASSRLLLLYDIRKQMIPVLQWDHVLDNPYYADVFSLSELRSHPRNDKYNWASESGFCIIMGSFWNCEFCVFYYGPSLPALRGSMSSKIAKFYKSLYAWELPSELSLSGRECPCGSCLTREEFLKDSLPEWTDWQQKKEIVLGFGILDKKLSRMFSEPNKFGGFTLIRLISSGKLELQRYCASWDCETEFEEAHINKSMCVENYFLYSIGGEEYKFPRRFKYMQLDYLYAFLNGKLLSFLDSSIIKASKGPNEKDYFSANFHEILCEKLKACGVIQSRSFPPISNVLNDTCLPTSIHELAVRRMWAGLPMDLLQLAFSCYSELLEVVVDKKKMSLEFLAIPDQPQLPPFFLRKPSGRSNKWSHKVQRGNDLVGPVLPLPVLHTLHDIGDSCLNFQEANIYRFEKQLTINCNEVKQAASELSVFDSGSNSPNDHVVSLADDREEPWGSSKKSKPFFLYNQGWFSDKGSHENLPGDHSDYKDDRFTTLICKLHTNNLKGRTKTVGLELFDDLCPVELKFDARALEFEPMELKSFKLLKRQFSRWQDGFDLYQDFCNQSKPQKQEKDYGLIVPNGIYAMSASHCVQCSSALGNHNLYCTPASLVVSCSSMQCRNSNLILVNVTVRQSTAGCNVTSCNYNGYVNGTNVTALSTSLQPRCPGAQLFPPLIAPPSSVIRDSFFGPAPAPQSDGAGTTPKSSTVPATATGTGSLPGGFSPANGPTGSFSDACSLVNPLRSFPAAPVLYYLSVKFMLSILL